VSGRSQEKPVKVPMPGVGGPASSEKAAKRCTALNWTVGPTLIKEDNHGQR